MKLFGFEIKIIKEEVGLWVGVAPDRIVKRKLSIRRIKMVYCEHCRKTYNDDLLELEDGYYYCHVCGQQIESKPLTNEQINESEEDEDLKERD